MSNHKTYIAGVDPYCQAKCSCRMVSAVVSRADAMEWEWHHQQEVQRARAGLRKQPSLRNQRDWFLERADDPLIPDTERDLWLTLAHELDHRIETSESDENQMELW